MACVDSLRASSSRARSASARVRPESAARTPEMNGFGISGTRGANIFTAPSAVLTLQVR